MVTEQRRCEVCGAPATYGYAQDDGTGEPGDSVYLCDKHGPEDVHKPAHCRDCYFWSAKVDGQ